MPSVTRAHVVAVMLQMYTETHEDMYLLSIFGKSLIDLEV